MKACFVPWRAERKPIKLSFDHLLASQYLTSLFLPQIANKYPGSVLASFLRCTVTNISPILGQYCIAVACVAWQLRRAQYWVAKLQKPARTSGEPARKIIAFSLLPPQSPRTVTALAHLYLFARPTKTAMPRRLELQWWHYRMVCLRFLCPYPLRHPQFFCCFLKKTGSVKTRTDLKIIEDGWKEIKRKIKVAFQESFSRHFVALSTARWEISFLPFFFGFGVYKNFLQIHPCTLELHLDGA